MPQTDVFFYAERNVAPALEWMDGIGDKARDKLFYRVTRLEAAGYELRRPEADILRDGIYELRVGRQHVNYRLLYFFHEKEAVIAHGCTKKGAVDDADIDRAIERKQRYQKSPADHRYEPPDEPG